jgi:hypothetical protein
VTVTRATVGRLRRQVEAARRAMPPVVFVVEPGTDDASRARKAEAERKRAAIAATGRRTALIVVDRDDG